jgi:hypothetical protein
MTGDHVALAHREGFQKIVRCYAKAKSEGHRYVWIDTCCIDKSGSAELSEAINSMFRWYREADICYAYLDDVHSSSNPASEWPSFPKKKKKKKVAGSLAVGLCKSCLHRMRLSFLLKIRRRLGRRDHCAALFQAQRRSMRKRLTSVLGIMPALRVKCPGLHRALQQNLRIGRIA